MRHTTVETTASEVDILARLFDRNGGLPASIARHLIESTAKKLRAQR